MGLLWRSIGVFLSEEAQKVIKDYQRILPEMLELGPVYFDPTDPTVI